MSTTKEFIEYAVEKLQWLGGISYKKMFGEYLIYYNLKPFVLVCDSTCYLKINEVTSNYLSEKGIPYKGAKEQYILDIENDELNKVMLKEVVGFLK